MRNAPARVRFSLQDAQRLGIAISGALMVVGFALAVSVILAASD